ncbi:hypothetical protein [Paenibacillus elgii]|uniref:hypothetical protein n=1 Tax=Paenibacillus elgii TaxID=189691 RepID=UPI001EF87565|nr:hypothetical protein [Paenibacillus elgii]
MYLDIIILPSGEVVQKDADELKEALRNGTIDNQLYDMAWEESARVNALVKHGEFHLLKLSEEHKDFLSNRL